MKYIEHVIETNRLVLCWQATESKNRSRFVVGELVRDDDGVVDLCAAGLTVRADLDPRPVALNRRVERGRGGVGAWP